MNPAILSPTSRFAVPEHRTGRRSPSISPDRWRYSAKSGLDPLLFNLSPSSTLQALEAPDAPLSGHDVLQDSLAAASASDRIFGIRVALAGKKLKEWHREISAWPWPDASLSNGFRPAATTQHGRGRLNLDHEGPGNGFATATSAKEHGDFDDGGYCGSIPEKLVQEYEDRIEAIQHDMGELEVEDLKEFVRDAHMNPTSRPQRRRIPGQGIVASDYNHLDDFTAVVTATIMHALPTISRLSSLLSVWSTRLAVLRQVPGFLRLLNEAQIDMETGVNMYQNTEFWGNGKDLESMETAFSSRRGDLEAKIFEIGRRLDAMLDMLECKEDTVPEEWIDEMEALESDFSGWVVETERSLMEHSLTIHRREGENKSPSEQLEIFEKGSPVPTPSGHEALVQDDWMTGEDGGGSIEPQNFGGDMPSPFTLAGPRGSGRPVDRTQDARSELSRPSQERSRSGAESLPASTLLENDIEQPSAPGDFDLQRLKLQQKPQRETGPYERVEEDLRLVDSETDSSVFERATILDNSKIDERNKDSSRDGDAHTPPRRDAIEDINIDTDSTVSAESGLNQTRSPEPRNEVLTDGAIQLFSDNTMKVERSAPKRTRSLSSPVYPTTVHDLKAQLPEASVNQPVTTPRPSPLIIRSTNMNYDGNASSEISSDTSHPGSGTSEYFSNMSSPEIEHASLAEYFENPVEVTTPLKTPSTPLPTLSRQSSQRTERGESLTHGNGITLTSVRPTNHTRRASSFAPNSTKYESTRPGDEHRVRPNYLNSHSRVRSASLRSFEIIPRNEVKTLLLIYPLCC